MCRYCEVYSKRQKTIIRPRPTPRHLPAHEASTLIISARYTSSPQKYCLFAFMRPFLGITGAHSVIPAATRCAVAPTSSGMKLVIGATFSVREWTNGTAKDDAGARPGPAGALHRKYTVRLMVITYRAPSVSVS